MDMAGHLGGGGSRAGSFSLEVAPLMGGQDHSETHLNLPEDSSLITLARRNTKRNRSIRNKKVMEFQDIIGGSRRPSCDSGGDQALLRPGSFINHHRRSPSHRQNSPSYQRSPSPRRRYPHHLHHDIGFSDTVSNVVEIVKQEHQMASQRHRFPRGSWSASTSPTRSPSPTGGRHNPKVGGFNFSRKMDYGTTSLCQRSRSPSPTNSSLPHHQGPPFIAGAVVGIPMQKSAAHQGNVQHSHPTLGGRKGQGRRLPPTPCKPSTLQLRPGSINFPKLNASPTHQHFQSHSAHVTPHNHPHTFPLDREPLREISPPEPSNISNVNVSINPGVRDANQTPLSFEQAVAMGRGGRVLPSPLPNGYKPKPTGSGHSESDEDDWC